MSYKGNRKGNYGVGARRAWETRNSRGWHRKTRQEKKAELVMLAREKLTGSNLQVAEKDLTHRYRSKGKELDVIKAYEQLLKSDKAKSKAKIKGEDFTKVLKEEIAANPAINQPNYVIVRANVSKKLGISPKEFDEILGYTLQTGKIKNVWLFPSVGQSKIYHDNMNVGHPFDSIEEQGEGICYSG